MDTGSLCVGREASWSTGDGDPGIWSTWQEQCSSYRGSWTHKLLPEPCTTDLGSVWDTSASSICIEALLEAFFRTPTMGNMDLAKGQLRQPITVSSRIRNVPRSHPQWASVSWGHRPCRDGLCNTYCCNKISDKSTLSMGRFIVA